MKKNNIHIEVSLNEQKVPTKINWVGEGKTEQQDAKAMLLSFFDTKTKDTLKLDLWTVDMEVGEMDQLVYYTIRSMADTYMNATGNKALAEEMQKFAHFFGQQTEIVNK